MEPVYVFRNGDSAPAPDDAVYGRFDMKQGLLAKEIMAEQQEVYGPLFDVTSALGPMDSNDAAFIKALQAHEARGTLTGGLGQDLCRGLPLRVRDSELLGRPCSMIQRAFSRRSMTDSLRRVETMREAAQDEANRRGQVVEVVLDEPADLSNMDGFNVVFGSDARLAHQPLTHVFYPQPNWKPFSMRWPWLAMLILVSVVLAVMQEMLYRTYRKEPMLRFKSSNELKPAFYFAIKFVPTLSAVVYGVLWQFTDFEVRRLEAFYQLSKKGGALAARSINVDYVSGFNFLRPIRALLLGHYAVALSSIATTFAVSLVPVFAAASVVLSPSRSERLANPDVEKVLRFSATWSRLLTLTLVLCALAGCALSYMLHSRRSGLVADVRSIAGLASMAVASHILMDFRDMDTAKHKDIHHRLKRHRYMLRNSSLAPADEMPMSSLDPRQDQTHLPESPHPIMLRPEGWIPFMMVLSAFLVFIPAFLFTQADVVTEKAPWVVTAIAVSLKLAWNTMETAVRMMEPFYRLSRRHAPARTLMLDYTALPFGYLPIRALLNGHMLVFTVGFGSIMVEFLTIMVAGLAAVDGLAFLSFIKQQGGDSTQSQTHGGQETVRSFLLSLALSVFILVYMGVAASIVFFRRGHPFLPRQPNTIASVLAFIHQSKMLYDFVGTSRLDHAEMGRMLDRVGKTYGLGWFQGRDGQTHCGVDQEELMSGYKHGLDYSLGKEPWNIE